MGVQAWVAMTEAQKDAAEALNQPTGAKVEGRHVNNPLANNLGFGTLVGMWVAPARILNDAAYDRWLSTLGKYPIHVLDDETIFLPPDMTGV